MKGNKIVDKGNPESLVLTDCLAYLKARGVFCWRQNTGAFKIGNRFVRTNIAGVSDIIGVLPGGRFLAVECKREKGGRVNEAQQKFIQSVITAGGLALVVHSVEELREKLIL